MKAWSTYQLQTLKTTYNCMTNANIAKMIGKTKRSVELAKLKLNLVRYHVVNYTPEEELFLKMYYSTTGNKTLGMLLKRSPGGIKLKLKHLGLKRTALQVLYIRKNISCNSSISNFRFKSN